jgi:beta-lactamase class A
VQDHFGAARAAIGCARFRTGALVRSSDGETLLEHAADEPFPSASVIKVPLAMALYADAAAGRIDLAERVPVGDRVDGSGVLRDLRDIAPLSLRDLAALMIGLSDNTATNRVIERYGLERTAAKLAEWGCRQTALRRSMYDTEAQKRGIENVATARELVSLLTMLVAGELVDRATSDAVLALMERCQDDGKLRRFLAPDATVASKSGTLDASLNDVAVFRGPARTVIAAVFTREVKDKLAAEHLLGLIGRGAALAAGMDVPALPFALEGAG